MRATYVRPGMRAREAVEAAGGITPAGDLSQVRVGYQGEPIGTLDLLLGDAPLQIGYTVAHTVTTLRLDLIRALLAVVEILLGMIILGILWYIVDGWILAPIERATGQRWGLVTR